MPIRKILSDIHGEILSRYYGCGLTVPPDLECLQGLSVCDLGSGVGRDCYILSKLVGQKGNVIGTPDCPCSFRPFCTYPVPTIQA